MNKSLTLLQSVLDVSNRAQITTAAEIDLSRDEDSVQSVGSLATKDGLIIYAGINSSEKEQAQGKNEHLRSFEVKYPPRKKQKTEKTDGEADKGQWSQLGKSSLFKAAPASKDSPYQRILRLSPSQRRESGSKRIGAIATGFAKPSQVIVFDATSSVPSSKDVLASIDLPDRAEANDLDIAEPEETEFSVAYCTDYHIFEQTLKYDFKSKKTEKTPKGPRRVVQTPDSSEIAARPKYRCLRFLNSQNVIALINLPNKKGAELKVYHLYPTGPAMLMQTKKLPGHIKQASSMDVCALDPDNNGNQQFAIAVAGQDISIEVYTTNYQHGTDTFSPFASYITLRDVHENQMTKICFSPFHSPPRATDASTGKNGEPVQGTPHPGPQYIRLASVSFGNSVVVDTFPLSPLEPSNIRSRYVLSRANDETWMKVAYVAIVTFVVLVFAFLFQSFRTGFVDDNNVGLFGFLPKNVREFLHEPAMAAYGGTRVEIIDSATSIVAEAAPTAFGRLQARMLSHEIEPEVLPSSSDATKDDETTRDPKKGLIIRSAPEGMGGVTVDVHPDKEAYRERDADAKHWHELDEEQKDRWKERLMKAGEWAEAEGEKVLFGVLFSEYAGLVGEGVGNILREL